MTVIMSPLFGHTKKEELTHSTRVVLLIAAATGNATEETKWNEWKRQGLNVVGPYANCDTVLPSASRQTCYAFAARKTAVTACLAHLSSLSCSEELDEMQCAFGLQCAAYSRTELLPFVCERNGCKSIWSDVLSDRDVAGIKLVRS